jgi:hypothetical protein
MQGMYLYRNELADLVGCKETSYACMRRWLENNDWPYAESISGFPKVSRVYHDQRMLGCISRPSEISNTPNFDALTTKT